MGILDSEFREDLQDLKEALMMLLTHTVYGRVSFDLMGDFVAVCLHRKGRNGLPDTMVTGGNPDNVLVDAYRLFKSDGLFDQDNNSEEFRDAYDKTIEARRRLRSKV